MGKTILYDFVDPADSECVRREVEFIVRAFYPDHDLSLFKRAFEDVEKLFFGMYNGYQGSNTKYHDFEHTCSVVLAQARLIYGAMIEGNVFSADDMVKGILSSLFHDVGLIQTIDDTQGTGAKHTVGHEERSIQFMREYLDGALFIEDIEDIADCIRCTILAMSPAKIAFRTKEMRMMGYILGSADLLAQIADRYYLEKLLLLFEEFKEANLPGYATAFDLLAKTGSFYKEVARKRLDTELENVDLYMRPYFKMRWKVDKDLYAEAIDRNLKYLNGILTGCQDDLDCFLSHLRRSGLSVDIMK